MSADRHRPARYGRSAVQAGFTLVEMLVVLAILGLSAAGAVTALGPMRDRGLLARSNAAMTGLIARAHALSIREGRPVWIHFDLDNHTATVTGTRLRTSWDRVVTLSLTTAREAGTGTDQGILFLPDGTGSGGRLRLEIANSNARVRTLRVSWLTGTVTDER